LFALELSRRQPVAVSPQRAARARAVRSRVRPGDDTRPGRGADCGGRYRRSAGDFSAQHPSAGQGHALLQARAAARPLAAVHEFLERCARAWLVWAPEGFGWDCFRSYEAAVCGSVPLMNRPTIERYQPLIEGVHALYYDVEPGELGRAVMAALADRDRLVAIAA